MIQFNRIAAFCTVLFIGYASLGSAQTAPASKSPISVSVFDRTRVEAWQWFAAPPLTNSYGDVQSLIRIGIAQQRKSWDWQLELAQPAVLDLPSMAVSSVAAQGQLGLGGTYYAANANTEPAAAFFKQGYARYHFGASGNLRAGRFEFFDGQETKPKNATIAWMQNSRIAQRLIGNFGFSNAQRSFDGIDGQYNSGAWNITAVAARTDQGVFNMNGNPELNADFQYLALTHSDWKQRVLWRAFAAGYHDGRTGLTKTDNRALAVRAADHENIRIGSYGGDLLAAIPAGPAQFDFLFWGVVQNGKWGPESHSANAVALEGGYKMSAPKAPWMRGGWFRSSGDNNNTDGSHNTFFQMLPTPRVYARLPFYNLMNSSDEFVQVMDKPVKNVAVRADLHWLQLTSSHDLWYLGGGAFDNKVFGFVGRPSNGFTSLASVADVSADWQANKNLALNFYYAYAQGKSVVKAIYPTGANMQYGYVELVYHWGIKQKETVKQ